VTHGRRTEHEMGLRRVTFHVNLSRRQRRGYRRWHAIRFAAWCVGPARAVQRFEQAIVIDVTANGNNDVLGVIGPPM
jgi:hypothetical protein